MVQPVRGADQFEPNNLDTPLSSDLEFSTSPSPATAFSHISEGGKTRRERTSPPNAPGPGITMGRDVDKTATPAAAGTASGAPVCLI